jgi:hypothetical protein
MANDKKIPGLPDREHDSTAEAYVFGIAPSVDAADYELKDVEDSPIPGHQEEIPKEEAGE